MEKFTEQEQAFLEAVKAEVKKTTEGFLDTKALNEALAGLRSEFQNVVTEAKFKELEDIAVKQGLEIKAMKDAAAYETKWVGIFQQVKEQLTANKDAVQAWREKRAPFTFNIKSVDNYTRADVTNATNVYSTTVDRNIAPVALEGILFKRYARVFNTNTPQLVYIDEGTPEGAATVVTEGSGKPQIDTHYTATPILPTKFAAYIKISDEMLADLDFVAAEITNNLITRLEATTDGLLATTGSWGFEAIVPGYTSTSLDDKVHDANIIDVIQAYANQIREAHYVPNIVIVRPADYSLILLHKDTNHRSDSVVTYGADGVARIWGLPIVQSMVLEAGHVCVGDFSKVNLGVYQGITVEMGYDSADFTNNMKTIRAEQRLFFYIKTQERNAFCYDAWATTAAQLESGGT